MNNERKIIDYCIIETVDIDGLVKKVKELISKGWQPQGNMTVAQFSYSRKFCQTMVIYDKAEVISG